MSGVTEPSADRPSVGIDMNLEDPGLDVPTSDDPLETVGDLMSADTDPLPDEVVPGAQTESDAG